MADVFVSYARSDRARVESIVAAIKAAGWSVWWDTEIAAGQEFDQRIEAELAAARAVVVVWTPASVTSRWVRGEARAGADRGILVPVRFDGAVLPIDVRAIYTADLDGWGDDTESAQALELIRALGAIVARQPVRPAAAPERAPAAGPLPLPLPERTAEPPASVRIAICVLPFANMSGDPEQEYFSDGITEDIITDLSKVSTLAVISRNSAFTYKSRSVDISRIARELKVSHILEGSVRKAGESVRITAQLIDGSRNEHVWAERYDRALHHIFALQDEISGAIVKALKLTLLPRERKAIQQRGTENIEAYNLYLMARHLYVGGHEGDARRADSIVRFCSRATEIDPSYGRAWALLALGQMILRFLRGKQFDDGLAAAERALALDATLAEAHAVKARIFSEEGRYDEASAEIDAALRMDRESYEVNRSAAYLRYRQHRPADAARFFEKAMNLVKSDVNSPSMLISCYTAMGDTEAAAQAARTTLARTDKVLAQDPNNAAAIAYGADAWATLGDAERAKEWMNRALLIDSDNMKTRFNFACTLAAQLKDPEGALALLGPVFEEMAVGLLNHAKADPDLDSLRADARFQAMIARAEKRLGISPGP
jgi:adenylate cyclase